MKSAGLMDGFSKAEIEAGRRLFAGDWNFASAASSPASLPAMAGPEIAFAGRSNVGKSSLINALTGRRALARTSNTPGRTQELIFFGGPHRLVVVDMPGYGYAAAAKSKIAAWTSLIHELPAGPRDLGARLPAGRCTPWAQGRPTSRSSIRSARPRSATKSFSPNATRSARRNWPNGWPQSRLPYGNGRRHFPT